MDFTKWQCIRHVLAGVLLVVVIMWTLAAEVILVLQDISALAPTPSAETQDGATLVAQGQGGASTCVTLYDEFRTQASRHGLAAIPIGLLAALSSVLVAVVVPIPPKDAEATSRSLTAALAAQPRIPLFALAALLWACVHHHASILGEARELAAAAVDAMTVEPVAKGEDLRRKCLTLRAAWERQRGEATSALARRMDGYGTPSDTDRLGLEATARARVWTDEVKRHARSVADNSDASASEQQDSLRALLEHPAEVISSVQMVELAVDVAVREGASMEDVKRWRTSLDDATIKVEDARREGERMLSAQPVVAPPSDADVATVPKIASTLAEASTKVDEVSHEVEDFLRRGDSKEPP